MTTVSLQKSLSFYAPISVALISMGITAIQVTVNQKDLDPALYNAGIACGGALALSAAAMMTHVAIQVSSCVLSKIGEFATSFTCRNDCVIGMQVATMGGIGCAVSLFHSQFPWALGCFLPTALSCAYLALNKQYLYVAPVKDSSESNLLPYHLDTPCLFGNLDRTFQMSSAGAALEMLKFNDDWRRVNYLKFTGATASQIREMIQQNLQHVKQAYKTQAGGLASDPLEQKTQLENILRLKYGLSVNGMNPPSLTSAQIEQRQILRRTLEINHPDILDSDGSVWITGKTITWHLKKILEELQRPDEVQRDAPIILVKSMS